MGSFSLWHWVVVAAIVMLLFGKGRFSNLAGDVAKGIKSFKKEMADVDGPASPPMLAERSAVPDAEQRLAEKERA